MSIGPAGPESSPIFRKGKRSLRAELSDIASQLSRSRLEVEDSLGRKRLKKMAKALESGDKTLTRFFLKAAYSYFTLNQRERIATFYDKGERYFIDRTENPGIPFRIYTSMQKLKHSGTFKQPCRFRTMDNKDGPLILIPKGKDKVKRQRGIDDILEERSDVLKLLKAIEENGGSTEGLMKAPRVISTLTDIGEREFVGVIPSVEYDGSITHLLTEGVYQTFSLSERMGFCQTITQALKSATDAGYIIGDLKTNNTGLYRDKKSNTWHAELFDLGIIHRDWMPHWDDENISQKHLIGTAVTSQLCTAEIFQGMQVAVLNEDRESYIHFKEQYQIFTFSTLILQSLASEYLPYDREEKAYLAPETRKYFGDKADSFDRLWQFAKRGSFYYGEKKHLIDFERYLAEIGIAPMDPELASEIIPGKLYASDIVGYRDIYFGEKPGPKLWALLTHLEEGLDTKNPHALDSFLSTTISLLDEAKREAETLRVPKLEFKSMLIRMIHGLEIFDAEKEMIRALKDKNVSKNAVGRAAEWLTTKIEENPEKLGIDGNNWYLTYAVLSKELYVKDYD